MSLLLLGAAVAAKYLSQKMQRSAPSAPRCDGCTGPLPERHAYTTCCHNKLCDTCVELYRQRSPVRCCLCRTPH